MTGKTKAIKRICNVPNQKGLHARAAAQIVSLSTQYQCDLVLTHKNKSAPGLSLLKLLTLDAPRGSNIEIVASGKEAENASIAICELFLNGFGELDD